MRAPCLAAVPHPGPAGAAPTAAVSNPYEPPRRNGGPASGHSQPPPGSRICFRSSTTHDKGAHATRTAARTGRGGLAEKSCSPARSGAGRGTKSRTARAGQRPAVLGMPAFGSGSQRPQEGRRWRYRGRRALTVLPPEGLGVIAVVWARRVTRGQPNPPVRPLRSGVRGRGGCGLGYSGGAGCASAPSPFEADYLSVEHAKIYVGRSRHLAGVWLRFLS